MDTEKVKIAVIREGKVPPDGRVPLTPEQVKTMVDSNQAIECLVESSQVRCFVDQEYVNVGVPIIPALDAKSADFYIGVKEVPLDQLIAGCSYFFFSHTAKMQPYNKKLLQTIVDKGVTLIDWEYLTDSSGQRLIGFGRYAGIVGAYNGLRAYGLRTERFDLKPANACADRREVSEELKKVSLPPMRILLTGSGRVAQGAMEILDELKLPKLDQETYLAQAPNEAVYTQITFKDYFRNKNSEEFVAQEFFDFPERFESCFMNYAKETDLFIAGHYWGSKSPFLFTREDARSQDFKIKVIADISCDIDGPVASTLRPSTIADPLYGYDPVEEAETSFNDENAITVMAVDNLPCELPKDASMDFGEAFLEHVLPNLLNGDKDEVIHRATIVKSGNITERFAHLRDWLKE